MAHKHNRRRVRPRVRQNKQNYYTNNLSYDTLSLRPQLSISHAQYNQSFQLKPQPRIPQYISGVNHPHYLPRTTSFGETRYSPKHAIEIESERIKMFGGEPGESDREDIGLCFRMAELFEEMDWVNV